MSTESPLNFFSSSFKKKKKQNMPDAAVKKEDEATPQNTAASQPLPLIKKSSKLNKADPELNVMFKEMYDMRSKLDGQVDYLCRTAGLTKEQLTNYAHYTEGLTSKQKEFLESSKSEFSAKVRAIIGDSVVSPPKSSRDASSGGDRRAKTVGSRRRWMPMN